MRSVSVRAPGKINLGLHVLQKRSDGFHDLETVFVAIDWADHIVLTEASEVVMECSDHRLPVNEQNLCIRAAHVLSEHTGVEHGVSIFLDKLLPWGAGLGSGSSDAAATLVGLCDLWKLSPSYDELCAMAIQLGSDVPFFLDPRPALGTGRGEELAFLDRLQTEEVFSLPYSIVIVHPEIHISSKEAYAAIRPIENRRVKLDSLVMCADMSEWRESLVNDFETVVFSWYPALADIKNHLYESGAEYVSMTGSGSSIFALYRDEATARLTLEASGMAGWVGRALV